MVNIEFGHLNEAWVSRGNHLGWAVCFRSILNLVVLKPSIEREILGRRLELWCGAEFLFFRKWFEKILDFDL